MPASPSFIIIVIIAGIIETRPFKVSISLAFVFVGLSGLCRDLCDC